MKQIRSQWRRMRQAVPGIPYGNSSENGDPAKPLTEEQSARLKELILQEYRDEVEHVLNYEQRLKGKPSVIESLLQQNFKEESCDTFNNKDSAMDDSASHAGSGRRMSSDQEDQSEDAPLVLKRPKTEEQQPLPSAMPTEQVPYLFPQNSSTLLNNDQALFNNKKKKSDSYGSRYEQHLMHLKEAEHRLRLRHMAAEHDERMRILREQHEWARQEFIFRMTRANKDL